MALDFLVELPGGAVAGINKCLKMGGGGCVSHHFYLQLHLLSICYTILLGIEEDPAKVKAEIQETRQLEKRERESRKSVQAATANLYQQLKRRSGKKKGGR